jgi:uncharacterized protein (DUF58 family)
MRPTDVLDPATLSRIGSMELRARLIVEGFITGLHKSPYHGFSVEFAEHRPYNAGDELRHVDWKVYARTDRPYVKRYEEETNLRHWVVLDTSPSMRYAGQQGVSKLEVGASISAALHLLMQRQRDATGLAAFDEQVHTLMPPKSSARYVRALLAALGDLAEDPPKPERKRTDAAHALGALAERIGRRALVVVVSDLFENAGADGLDGLDEQADRVLRALRHLRHRGHEVLVLHVLDEATERRFDFPDRPVRLKDAETGETMTVQPAQLREAYAEAADRHLGRFRRRCREMQVDLVPIDTARPFADALAAYLQKRRRLH